MIKRWSQAIVISGAAILFIGIAAAYFKINSELKLADLTSGNPNYVRPLPTSFDVFILRFPAIEFGFIGTVLLIVGYLGTRPWKSSDNSK